MTNLAGHTELKHKLAGEPSSPILDLPGLDLWLDAAAGDTLFKDVAMTTIAVEDEPVAVWKDKSGDNNATQTALARTPTLKGDSVYFDGTDALVFTITQALPFVAWIVLDNTLNGTSWRQLLPRTSSIHPALYLVNNKPYIYWAGSGGGMPIHPLIINGLALIRFGSDGVNHSISVNGVADVTASAVRSELGNWTGITIYNLQQYKGLMNEMVLCQGTSLTAQEITEIDDYLMNKWGL